MSGGWKSLLELPFVPVMHVVDNFDVGYYLFVRLGPMHGTKVTCLRGGLLVGQQGASGGSTMTAYGGDGVVISIERERVFYRGFNDVFG